MLPQWNRTSIPLVSLVEMVNSSTYSSSYVYSTSMYTFVCSLMDKVLFVKSLPLASRGILKRELDGLFVQ